MKTQHFLILTFVSATSLLAQTTAPDRFKQLDKNGDGKLTRNEVADAAAFTAADTDEDGTVTVDEYRRYVAARPKPSAPNAQSAVPASPAPAAVNGLPVLKQLPDCDAVRDAEGTGQLFECVHVPGITDHRAGMNGFAIVDLNRDGRPDVVATTTPMDAVPGKPFRDSLRVLINEGGFRFREHRIEIRGSDLSQEVFGQWSQIPNFADLNQDGFLDLLVTRSSQSRNRQGTGGNTLLLSDGAWDRFVDASATMGLRNETAYNRQTSFGDVNGDGWLDVAIGCDNIKNANGGVPHSRLYVFKPNGPKFENGRFEDIGGSELVPDFGGFYRDSAKDKAGPDVNLRDLDNDGDLDLIQSFHVDVRDPLAPNSPGEYRQGVMCWKNLLRETGQLRFEKVKDNGLACEASMKYNRDKQVYEPVGKAPGLPYLFFADVDNDGLQDVLALGPSDIGFAPRAEDVGGRFWKNKGNFQFEEATGSVGLDALNWTYREWYRFLNVTIPLAAEKFRPKSLATQPGRKQNHPLDERFYFANANFGDFNNDGWIDLIVLDRHEAPTRPVYSSALFLNRGDGTFEPTPTTFSGLNSTGISSEIADLNNDGLLDIVFACDPDNSGGGLAGVASDRYQDKVHLNTGSHGARENHWLHLTFTGLSHAELVGARVDVTADGKKQYRWIHSNHSYKSGGQLDAHFGLGKANSADVMVTLLNGHAKLFKQLAPDRSHQLKFTRP